MFRPLSPGDYSTGVFSILLNSPTGDNMRDISLVEKAITVGGVALNAGDFLITQAGGSNARDVWRFAADERRQRHDRGHLYAADRWPDIGFGQDIGGMEFVNETFTLGGKTFQAGQFIMSLLGNDSAVGSNNIAVTKFDLFVLDVTQAGPTTAANATLLVQGSDLALTAGGEEFDALAIYLPATTVSITNPTVTEGTDTHAVFTLSLSSPATTATTFSLTLNNGTATGGGTDFGPAIEVSTDGGTTWTPSTSATIAAGATSVLVRTAINNDTLDENAESFTLTATRTAGTTTNTTVTGTATINDNDPPPTISINDVTVNEGAGTATFTVSLNTASGLPVSVNYSMANGTAGAADYTAGSGTLNFAAGVTTQTIVVPILEDTLDEVNETFTVNLASPTNATIADGSGIGTITDNDAAAVADDQRCDRGRERRDGDVHGDAERGEQSAGERGLLDEQRDGDERCGLHGRDRDAELRGGRDDANDHGADPRRTRSTRRTRLSRSTWRTRRMRRSRDGTGRGDDHGQRRGADA